MRLFNEITKVKREIEEKENQLKQLIVRYKEFYKDGDKEMCHNYISGMLKIIEDIPNIDDNILLAQLSEIEEEINENN